jgi:hypothetical protein
MTTKEILAATNTEQLRKDLVILRRRYPTQVGLIKQVEMALEKQGCKTEWDRLPLPSTRTDMQKTTASVASLRKSVDHASC